MMFVYTSLRAPVPRPEAAAPLQRRYASPPGKDGPDRTELEDATSSGVKVSHLVPSGWVSE